MTRLETARLILRRWRPEDLAPFAMMNADPRVAEFLSGPMDRAASDAMVDRIEAAWKRDGFGLFAVERLEDGAFLGFTGLSRPNFEAAFTPCVEIGWRFGPDAWGHGYATEAGAAALAWGFDTVGLTEILSWTAAVNTRSVRVMERIGLVRDLAGDFDHPRFPAGHPLCAHVLYRASAPTR